MPLWRVFQNRRGGAAGFAASEQEMTDDVHIEPGSEVERYELRERPRYRFSLDRRTFFKSLGAGIVVVSVLSRRVDAQAGAQESGAQESGGGRGGRGGRANMPQEIGGWLHVAADGAVTV